MKKILFLLAFLVLLVSCDPPETVSSKMGKWELVGETPGHDIFNGIYKLHSDKEKVTFYASQVHGGWSISVVKD